jgi:hypothetical protein
MNRIKLSGVATAMAAALIASPATAYADCGDPGQDPCTGLVPTVDQVAAIMAELTDPNIPAANKINIVTPGFTPDEAATIDDHLSRMNAHGNRLPLDIAVTNIQPAPDNLAGATIETNGPGPIYTQTAPNPIVLVDQHDHWLITHDSATRILDKFWNHSNRRYVPVVPFVP